ncbi:MAG: hypothetical protein GX629_05610 [Phycisphaerae bacterium]|nr:hypothetical protein [Phycisphaerae bacterium]
MAITGSATKARKMKWVLYMVLIAFFSGWHFYDGWFNEKYWNDPSNLWYNRVVAVVLAVLFVGFVIAFFLMLKSKVVVDEQGIRDGKKMIDWKSIVRIDDSKVEKGLVGIYYLKNDKEAKYLLDDYKIGHFEEMLDEISIHRPDLLTPVDDSVDQVTKK